MVVPIRWVPKGTVFLGVLAGDRAPGGRLRALLAWGVPLCHGLMAAKGRTVHVRRQVLCQKEENQDSCLYLPDFPSEE